MAALRCQHPCERFLSLELEYAHSNGLYYLAFSIFLFVTNPKNKQTTCRTKTDRTWTSTSRANGKLLFLFLFLGERDFCFSEEEMRREYWNSTGRECAEWISICWCPRDAEQKWSFSKGFRECHVFSHDDPIHCYTLWRLFTGLSYVEKYPDSDAEVIDVKI